MKKYFFLCAFLGMFLLNSCQDDEVLEDNTTQGSSTLKGVFLNLVNETRAEGCNCGDTYYPASSALLWNDTVEKAALIHCQDMVENDFFSHTGSDNSSAGDRLSRVYYDWSRYGENIAYGQTSANAAFTAWLNSEGHCRNIMNPLYTEFAVARVSNYWTMVLTAK